VVRQEWVSHGSGKQGSLGPPVRRTDDKVADSVIFSFDFFDRMQCEMAVLFQLNDGRTDTSKGRYGIGTSSGAPKIVADRIEEQFGVSI
jgi:hypothetical protein